MKRDSDDSLDKCGENPSMHETVAAVDSIEALLLAPTRFRIRPVVGIHRTFEDLSVAESIEQFSNSIQLSEEFVALFEKRGYTLGERLGKGGFGTVFSAIRHHPRQKVAIKVMENELGKKMLSQLRVEADVMAELNHPNIAHIYDADAMEVGTGIAYFIAMEYVDGARSITQALRESDIETRLKKIEDTARAIHAAHQRTVLHRDIKASNVLVDASCDVKIVDFGLAVTESIMLSHRLDTIPIAGTPEYMAPEQAKGQTPDVRDDVYSLGALAFQVLTGTRLRSAQNRLVAERLADARASRHHADWPSSTRKDVRAVVEKALASQREDRYQTAQDFADDLNRARHHKIVTALSHDRTYRTMGFLREHAKSLAAIGLLLTVIVVGAAASIVFALDARASEKLAYNRISVAMQTMRMVMGDFRSQNAGKTPSLEEMTFNKKRLTELSKRLPELSKNDLLVEAWLRMEVGALYVDLAGDYESEAREVSHALRILQEHPELTGLDQQRMAQPIDRLLGTLTHLGQVKDAGELATALNWYIQNAHSVSDSARCVFVTSLAEYYSEVGESQKALELLDGAWKLSEALPKGEYQDSWRVRIVCRQGEALIGLGHFDEAETKLRDSASMARRSLSPDTHPWIACPLHNLGRCMVLSKKYDDAIPILREAIELKERGGFDAHIQTWNSKHYLAWALSGAGGHDEEAERLWRDAIAASESTQPDPSMYTGRFETQLGRHFLRMGRYQDARQLIEDGARQVKEVCPITHPDVLRAEAALIELDKAIRVK